MRLMITAIILVAVAMLLARFLTRGEKNGRVRFKTEIKYGQRILAAPTFKNEKEEKEEKEEKKEGFFGAL